MSEDTVKAIDAEIRDFIDRNYDRAKTIIEENMDILHAMKDALMKYETIDAKQIDDLMARRDVRQPENWEPRDKPGSDDKPDAKTRQEESAGPAKPSEGNLH
jgi:cell division protease FtsH